jgi:hypothetical protein
MSCDFSVFAPSLAAGARAACNFALTLVGTNCTLRTHYGGVSTATVADCTFDEDAQASLVDCTYLGSGGTSQAPADVAGGTA